MRPLDPKIIFQNKDFLILNKPAGWVCQATKNESYYLGNWIFEQGYDIRSLDNDGRVHRIDKMTTGLLIWTLQNSVQMEILQLFQNREVIKCYHLLAVGKLPDKKAWRVNVPLSRHNSRPTLMQIDASGKEALTEFRVLRSFSSSLHYLEAQIYTGRTHQIRLHLKASKLNLLFDNDYHRTSNLEKEILKSLNYDSETIIPQALHAYHLAFKLNLRDFLFDIEDSFLIADIIKLFYNRFNE